MIHKLGLGTVQFGCSYGIANKTGQVSKDEAFKILEFARREGIKTLDTSAAYGTSEAVIGEFINQEKFDFDIVSKFTSQGQDVEEIFKESLRRLRSKNLYGYLFHRFDDFRNNADLWKSLERLKNEGLLRKAGFSLYLPEELELLLKKKIIPDILQVPYSVFDRRFEPYFPTLKEMNVELHARSIFLQGLVYLDPDQLSEKLFKARKPLEDLRKISQGHQIPLSALCLNYAVSNPYLDKVIVGVDSLEHLKEHVKNLEFLNKILSLKERLNCLTIQDEDILLPYKWS
ncbi:MAG: aldo/keto reductase [Candidatus Omnitrophica bacterium]|nr:aldo/keto reductase [Candidatus Omnitrophota bacterium]